MAKPFCSKSIQAFTRQGHSDPNKRADGHYYPDISRCNESSTSLRFYTESPYWGGIKRLSLEMGNLDKCFVSSGQSLSEIALAHRSIDDHLCNQDQPGSISTRINQECLVMSDDVWCGVTLPLGFVARVQSGPTFAPTASCSTAICWAKSSRAVDQQQFKL